MKRYQFTAYAAGQSREMNPSNVDGAKIRREREGDNIFFRKKLSGSLTFTGDDYLWLRALENSERRCEQVGFRIAALCQGEYVEQCFVYYSLTDAKIDLQRCTIVLASSVPGDSYKCVMDGYSKEYNVLAVPASASYNVTTKLDFNATFEFRRIDMGGLNEGNFGAELDTWAFFLETSYWIDGSGSQRGTRSRSQIIYRMKRTAPYENGEPADLSGENWVIIEDGVYVNGVLSARYAKQPDIYNFKPYKYEQQAHFTRYGDLLQIPCGQAYDTSRYVEVTGTNGANNAECGACLNLRRRVTENRCVRLIWEFGKFDFRRNRRLLDVVHHLVQQSCPVAAQVSANEISDFFTLPTNYATGEQNALKDLLISAKSDVIGFSSSEAATKAMLSLKNLLDDLRAQFQVYWYLDASGKFRLEHLSYFDQDGEVDLLDPDLARWMNSAYEYDKLNMPRYERLLFSEFLSDDFEKGEIEYSGSCVNTLEGQDSKELTVSRFDNDVANLLVQGESLNRQGFVLIAHSGGRILEETGDATGQTNLVNGHLSAANLVKHYYRHGRVLPSGRVNGKSASFLSTLKIRKQDPVILPCATCLQLNPFANYVTSLSSTGGFNFSELNLKTGSLSIGVNHNTDTTAGATTQRSYDDSYDESYR